MDRQAEITGLVRAFRATCMAEILAHRAQEQTPGVLDAFERKMRAHVEGHLSRLKRVGEMAPDVAEAAAGARQTITEIAESEIGRARLTSRVEFAE